MAMLLTHLLLLPALLSMLGLPDAVQCWYFIDSGDGRNLQYIGNRHTEHTCAHPHLMGSNFVIEGSIKMTTAPPPDNWQGRKICQTPLVPFGKLTQDLRGINFWYLRIKITQLMAGQFLVVVNTDASEIKENRVDADQRIDLTHTSHRYPAILYLNYRYARLYWNSTRDASDPNWVNITVSTYARFNQSVNATMRKDLCERYGNTWCRQKSLVGGVCIGPNSCSLQEDCFDAFTDQTICSDALWVNGNLTATGSSLRTTGWILRNLPWLALGAVPLVLIAALVKICSQKRDLDIDDDYEYKMSNSDHNHPEANGGGPARNGTVSAVGGDDADSSVSSDSDDNGLDEGSNGGAGPYYSYPSPGRDRQPPSHPPSTSPPSSGTSTAKATAEAGDVGDVGVDEAPPPPPPRLSQAQAAAAADNAEGVATRSAAAAAAAAPAAGGRALHRLTEVSLEDEEVNQDEEDEEAQEEEEFVNVEYLRRRMLRPDVADVDPRIPSGEYTTAVPSDDPDASGAAGSASPRSSYTRLLSQPSPDTIEELLRPLPTSGGGGGSDSGVVYAQLVLPPPSRSPVAAEALELQAVKAPAAASAAAASGRKGECGGAYDLNYIVV